MRVTDFKLVDPQGERTRLLSALEKFNRTARPYERDRALHDVLVERMREAGSAVAVSGEDSSMTHEELLAFSGRIASCLATLPPSAHRCCGVMMENTPEMIAAVLGALRAGAIYVPINPQLPLDRIRNMLADTGAEVLFTERRFAREANRLQWECPDLTHLICLDSASFPDEVESAGELSRIDLWEYVGEEAADAISGGGWKNSYTGQDLSAEIMAEYADNAYHKISPLLKPDSRVLEIGCSSGLTMFRLAPECGLYRGIDFSRTILAKTQAEVERSGAGNIRLECLAAHDLDRLAERDFDLVIVNSVAQNFNGHNYLRRVLLQAASRLKPDGRIFLGDLMDQDRKQALIDSLVKFQHDNHGKGFLTKTDWSAELFISRAWIEDLCRDIPGAATAVHSEKIGAIPNELTEFRFDSTIEIHRGDPAENALPRHKYQVSRPALDAFSPEPPPAPVPGGRAAYIIFTSGTTGKPKGVEVSHRGIHNYVQWAARYYYSEGGGNMALFTSPAFDLTLTSIFVPLYLGRSIRTFRSRDADRLLEEVFAAAGPGATPPVDAIKLTPSHIGILENCAVEPAPIRVAIVGGEDLTEEHVRILRRHAPGVRIYNEYGPTEATIGCTVCLVGEPPIHIGSPVDNSEIWILGLDGELKPVGAPGELCIAGDCLATGYWADAELTERKFVPHPLRAGERIYRTGDLARWMPDGNLTLLGRADHQVKIRGNRVELGEIESQLRQLAGVRDAVVLARDDNQGEKALCAYVIPAGQADIQSLRAALARVLPEFLIPSHFAFLEEFPLSLNGKLDRKRLPEPEAISRARSAEYEPPETPTEKALAAIWREVLGVSRIGRRDNFFELGGHSLKATQVASRVHRSLEATLELRQVFRNPALRDLASAVDDSRKFRFAAIDPAPIAEDYALSHAQRRLWILQQVEAGSIAYNIHDAIEIEGPLNGNALGSAFGALVNRHESLRTVIVAGRGGPRQKVLDDIGFHVEFEDLAERPDPEGAAAVIARREASAPFDLAVGPPIRVRILRLGAERHRLLLTMHHAVSDGWSSGIMIREVLQLYRAQCAGVPPDLPPLRSQYKDYAAWQNRLLENAAEHAHFWHTRLAAPLPVVDLPADFPRPAVQSFEGASLTFRVPEELAAAIRRLVRQERISLFMLLNAALKALIHRLTRAEDIILGVPVAGRTHVDLEGQIGFFVNTLALRDQVRGHEGFRELLSSVRRTTTDAYEHQVYPFDRLVNELACDRDTSRSPLFNIMLVLHNNEQPELSVEGLRIRAVAVEVPVSRFDLTFHFFEGEDGLTATLEYEPRIRRLWDCFLRLLRSACGDLFRPISTLDILPESERRLLDAAFQGPDAPWESPLTMFQKQVSARPDQPAVVCRGRRLTYRELDARATRLASAIRAHAEAEEIVAVLLDRSEGNLISLLGCLKAGCAYLPIDPLYPQERVQAMLQNSRARVVVTQGRPKELSGYTGAVVELDAPASGDLPEQREGHLAYIVYTSGSTGVPKGVACTTQCLGNLISWERRVIEDGLRSAQYGALGFDASEQEMLFCACSGGTLYVAGNEERYDPAVLRDFLDRNEIEQITMPFSGLNLLFQTQRGLERLRSLKHIITAGEQLRITAELRRFLESRPDVKLHNQYGPSETHVVTAFTLSSAARNLTDLPPIGRPIANTRCYILDANKQTVPIGVPGELFLAGANVADGYLNDPVLTARRFIEDPFYAGERMYQTGDLCRWRDDGEIEFLGRLDDQIKIRGYRVEPGEIEVLLLEHPDVQAACVIAWKTPAGQTELAAYYVAASPVEEGRLRGHLSRQLAPYMIPARFVYLETMPLTATGKANRRALPSPLAAPSAQAQPHSEIASATERRVQGAFAQVLEREHVGLDDDFFQLGGHSLRAVQLSAGLQTEFAFEVPLITVFQRSTVRRIAQWIDDFQTYRVNYEDKYYTTLNSSRGVPVFALPPLLGYAAAFRGLAGLLPSNSVVGFDFLDGPGLLDRYAGAIASVEPTGRVVLFGYSGGGNLGFELAKKLESAGRAVTLILLDSFRLDSTYERSEAQIQRAIQLNLEYFDRYLEGDADLRIFVSNETVRGILVKKMGGYLRHLDTIDNRGSIRGDIHLIESIEFAGDPRRAAWAGATEGTFRTYQGHGAHVEMILEGHVARNAEILHRILNPRE